MRRTRSTQLVDPLDAAITAISAASIHAIFFFFIIIIVSFPVGVRFFFCAVISRHCHLARITTSAAAAATDSAAHLYRRAGTDVVVVDLASAVPKQLDQVARLGREPASLDSRSRRRRPRGLILVSPFLFLSTYNIPFSRNPVNRLPCILMIPLSRPVVSLFSPCAYVYRNSCL